MSYRVFEKRECPIKAGWAHQGEKSVCVILEDERMAWGFAVTWEEAEKEAVKNAESVKPSHLRV